MTRISRGSVLALLAGLGVACSPETDCGPSSGLVSRVIDGDTIELDSGERVRYLLVDAPELTNGHEECFGAEARDFNRELVLGRRVTLRYDDECTDRYDRLLAYVSLEDGREVNALLVEQGYACVLHIPPNGQERLTQFQRLSLRAELQGRGLFAACPSPCK